MHLIELAEAGDVPGVFRKLGELTPEQRASYAAELLDAHFEAANTQGWMKLTAEQKIAMSSAQLGCQVTPQAAAAWLMTVKMGPGVDGWQVDVVNLYPAAWQVELVERIFEMATVSTNPSRYYRVVDHVVRTTGCPVPTSDAYLSAWLGDRSFGAGGPELAERLRDDDFTATLLPLIVARPDVRLYERVVSALCVFAAEGMVDRAALVRRVFAEEIAGRHPHHGLLYLEALALTPDESARMATERAALTEAQLTRLLQDSTRMETAPYLKLLRALVLTPAENAAFHREHVAMLDLSLPVAAYGQEVLTGLDEAGLLEDDVLTEVCERVLLRPEKKLVRAQLSWLDRVARRDSARTGRLLADAALTFQHRDMALQERALDVIARHLRSTEDSVLPQLRTAAGSLGPGLSARAAEMFGSRRDTVAEPYVEVLPAAPEPQLMGPIETAAEVATEVAVVLANREDVVAFERALDGLVRHARLDRSTLSKALEPVMRKEPARFRDWTQADLYDVSTAVRSDEPRDWHIHLRHDHPRYRTGYEMVPSPPGAMLKARLAEAIELVETDAQPFLLALPTHVTGALDAATLVERIAELESLGVTPAPVDLAQSLLRVTPTADERVRRAAGELGSEAGRWLARWLREGGLPHRDSTPGGWPVSDPTSAPPKWWLPEDPGPDHDPPLPPVAAALALIRYQNDPRRTSPAAALFWVMQLPHHREEVAARGAHVSERDVFKALVEAGGSAGYAMHWHTAWQLDIDKDVAVDALLVLAAQGQLDTELLAGQSQALMRCGASTPSRVVDALRAAAETGAYATVWSLLKAALPALLRDRPIRGAAAFLALAVECASRCGARGSIPEVETVAVRTGSSLTVKNARLLRDVLR